jgi:hypothetical protein
MTPHARAVSIAQVRICFAMGGHRGRQRVRDVVAAARAIAFGSVVLHASI